ncbi:MAG: hypothetical protein IJC83_05030 [Oscillospiraceae bacterium]|nr:hypothetical protein [Oscillospiraceae bacterium]
MEEFALKIIEFQKWLMQFLAENPNLAEVLSYLLKGFVFALPIFIMTMIVRVFIYMPAKRPKWLEKAKENGHIYEATYLKDWYERQQSQISKRSRCVKVGGIYTYSYKDKTRKYKYRCNNTPDKVEIYYIRNPKKPQSAGTLGYGEPSWKIIYFIIGLICTIVCYIFKLQW